jgi:large subunit ribosomal protein L5
MSTYFAEAAKRLQKELQLGNVHQVPRITAVMVTVGVGKQRDNANVIRAVANDVAAITGQRPQERMARQAVAGFNVRQGNLVGYRVTLRGKRAEDFTERFVKVTLPRVRDFRGIPLRSLDGKGNLSVGLSEQLSFPEIHPDKVDVIFGVQATFVTSAKDNAEGEALFRALGFPLTERSQKEVTLTTRKAATKTK